MIRLKDSIPAKRALLSNLGGSSSEERQRIFGGRCWDHWRELLGSKGQSERGPSEGCYSCNYDVEKLHIKNYFIFDLEGK